MKWLLIFLCALFQVLSSLKASASFDEAKVIVLESGISKEKFGQSLQYFYDRSAGLGLSDILGSKYQNEWQQVAEERPNWGFRDGKLWLYGRIQTPMSDIDDWVLDLGFHFFVTANFYVKQPDGSWKVSRAGKREPFANRELAHRNPAFVIRPSSAAQEFILELQSPAVLKIPGRIAPMSQFATDTGQFVFALYVGIVLALAIFHFALGLVARERVYFVYSLYAAATLMTICDIEGYSYRFLWADVPWWFLRSATVMACLSGIFGLLFASEFIRPNRVWRRFLYGMSSAQAVFMLVVLVKVNASILMVSHFMLAAAVILILSVAIFESFRKNFSARMFLAAFAIFGIGLMVFTLQNLGVISSTLLTQHGIGIGQAAEILMLSVALSLRINEIKTNSLANEFRNLRLADRVEAARWFAHESRRPYQGIVLGIENVLSKVTNTEAREPLLLLQNQSKKALARINSLARNLVYGSSDQKSMKSASVSEMLVRAIEEVKASCEGMHVDLECELPENCAVEVDEEQMVRVFVNLIANAVEASSAGEKVSINVHYDELQKEFVNFEIINRGSGISQEEIGKLFEPGYSKNKPGGMGLGLAMVQKIVMGHGSKVLVSSVKDNETFRISFSFSMRLCSSQISNMIQLRYDFAIPEIINFDTHNSKVVKASIRVLLADDDTHYITQLQLLCRAVFPRSVIRSMQNPIDALALALEFEPHLAILDLEFGLGERDGFWLLDRIKKAIPECRVILHSGKEDENLTEKALAAGAFSFVQKPFDQSQLIDASFGIETAEFSPLQPLAELPLLCIVDDEPKVVRTFFAKVTDAEVRFFSTPDQFLDFCSSRSPDFTRIQSVLCDYYFDGFNSSQVKFVRAIRKGGYVGPVLLFSNVPLGNDVGEEFDAKLEKTEVPSLKWLLEKLQRPT